MPLQIDSILQPYLTQYYAAIKQPTETFECILTTCDQLLQNRDFQITELKKENQQLQQTISNLQKELEELKGEND